MELYRMTMLMFTQIDYNKEAINMYTYVYLFIIIHKWIYSFVYRYIYKCIDEYTYLYKYIYVPFESSSPSKMPTQALLLTASNMLPTTHTSSSLGDLSQCNPIFSIASHRSFIPVSSLYIWSHRSFNPVSSPYIWSISGYLSPLPLTTMMMMMIFS
jgi:hypothetical protein